MAEPNTRDKALQRVVHRPVRAWGGRAVRVAGVFHHRHRHTAYPLRMETVARRTAARRLQVEADLGP